MNISIDNPIAVVDQNVNKHGSREVAEGFVKYLFTPEAQKEFAKLGFRPLDEAVAQNKELKALADKYTKVNNLGSVQDYGGWAEVQKKFLKMGQFLTKFNPKSSVSHLSFVIELGNKFLILNFELIS